MPLPRLDVPPPPAACLFVRGESCALASSDAECDDYDFPVPLLGAAPCGGGGPQLSASSSSDGPPLALPKALSPPEAAQQSGRRDLPAGPAKGRGRASMAEALSVLDDPLRRVAAEARLREAFFSNSSRTSASRKRRDVEELARRAAPCPERVYPLAEATVVGVAAALKDARFKSAEAYMGELRLGHVEARFEVPAWLARLLSQCKRALRRGAGPPNKAAELRLEDIEVERVDLRGEAAGDLRWPYRAYVVANRWLLRELELAGTRLAHVSFSTEERVVTLFLPVSKADTGGLGRERRLRCCCAPNGPEERSCPYHVLRAHVDELVLESGTGADQEAAWDIPLFPTVDGRVPTKAATVAGWQRLVSGAVSLGGHSARRSGAKRCAREGWQVLAIQHLGRWASAVVLEYIEEAYAEAPHGRPGRVEGELEWSATPPWEERLQALEKKQRALLEEVRAGTRPEAHGAVLAAPPLEREMLPAHVLLMTPGSHKVHRQASGHPLAPSWTWATRCGCRFAALPFRFLDDARLREVEPAALCKRCFKELGGVAAAPGGV